MITSSVLDGADGGEHDEACTFKHFFYVLNRLLQTTAPAY